MKKRVIIIAVVIVAGFLLGSCKSSERCPAYGQADQESVEANV